MEKNPFLVYDVDITKSKSKRNLQESFDIIEECILNYISENVYSQDKIKEFIKDNNIELDTVTSAKYDTEYIKDLLENDYKNYISENSDKHSNLSNKDNVKDDNQDLENAEDNLNEDEDEGNLDESEEKNVEQFEELLEKNNNENDNFAVIFQI